MPCVLLRILTWPVIVPASVRSMLRLARASSPKFMFEHWDPSLTVAMRLTKKTASIHVCRKEGTVTRQCAFWRQTRHVRYFHDLLQVVARVPWRRSIRDRLLTKQRGTRDSKRNLRQIRADINTIFPFKLCPHVTELQYRNQHSFQSERKNAKAQTWASLQYAGLM